MTSVAKSSDTTSIPNGLSLAKNDIKIPENPKPRKKDCVIRLSMPALTMKPQIPDKNPDIIVGCPGRIYDMLTRKKFLANNLKILVLDEADRMLSLDFEEELHQILFHH